jgi:hypothetical protein
MHLTLLYLLACTSVILGEKTFTFTLPGQKVMGTCSQSPATGLSFKATVDKPLKGIYTLPQKEYKTLVEATDLQKLSFKYTEGLTCQGNDTKFCIKTNANIPLDANVWCIAFLNTDAASAQAQIILSFNNKGAPVEPTPIGSTLEAKSTASTLTLGGWLTLAALSHAL